MKSLLQTIIAFAFIFTVSSTAKAQGCVAVKNMSSCSLGHDTTQHDSWQLSLNYRYFRSYKHFRGSHEEKHRVEQGTEVINVDNSVLLGASYTLNRDWSFAAIVPYMNIDRSSLYEHYGNTPGNPRFHTKAKGFGDVRLSAYHTTIRTHNFNLTTGLGFKLPTGNYNTKDYFHKLDSEGQDSLVYKVVDQSIQLGDGGFGVVVEFDASYMMSRDFSVYLTGLYLFNPRNTNGIERGPNLVSGIPLSNEFSVVDQFLFRTGIRYNTVSGFQAGLGARYEGIPGEDAIGKSDGWRRPGYIISVEPSVGYAYGNHIFGINLPIALKRNRVQNTIDKIRTQQSGEYTVGDAAFADWLLSISYAYKF